MNEASLKIELRDDEIIVTLPGTSYIVTYYKPANSPQLLAKHIADRDDKYAFMKLSEFLAEAFAVSVAR
ncbi:MAG: hypothetical protein ACLQF1_07965 [Methyloceanibacter sp.]|jgi:hypothetical protein